MEEFHNLIIRPPIAIGAAIGRMEKWIVGRMEKWKNGIVEDWNNGRLEGWNNSTI
jgi:hypothetical protein